MACDPAVLINQATCINACIPQGMMPAVSTYLLCQIAAGGGGGGAVFPPALLLALSHYWSFNEGSGTRVDSIAAANMSASAPIGSASGINGNAASFIGDFAFLSNNLGFTSPLSIAFWMRFAALPAGTTDVGGFSDEGGATSPFVELSAAGRIELRNPTDGIVAQSGVLSTGTWHLVVFTISGTAYQLSTDGGAFVPGAASVVPVMLDILFGLTDLGLNSPVALIDAVMLFNRVITATEVASLWNSGTGVFP